MNNNPLKKQQQSKRTLTDVSVSIIDIYLCDNKKRKIRRIETTTPQTKQNKLTTSKGHITIYSHLLHL